MGREDAFVSGFEKAALRINLKIPKIGKPPANTTVRNGQPVGMVERIRQGLTSTPNKVRTYVGMGVVGAGAGLYGTHKVLENTIGPSRKTNDW